MHENHLTLTTIENSHSFCWMGVFEAAASIWIVALPPIDWLIAKVIFDPLNLVVFSWICTSGNEYTLCSPGCILHGKERFHYDKNRKLQCEMDKICKPTTQREPSSLKCSWAFVHPCIHRYFSFKISSFFFFSFSLTMLSPLSHKPMYSLLYLYVGKYYRM